MKTPLARTAALGIAALTASCLASFPRWEEAAADPASTAVAVRHLDESIAAHGGDPYTELAEIRVGYDGEWGFLVSKVQPVLADVEYRQSSSERLVLADDLLEQTHRGPGGTKHVLRRPGTIEVSYDGAPADDAEVIASAALVADLYTLFLVGPGFVKRRTDELRLLEPRELDDRPHDRVLARLAPGLGLAEEDFVVLYIDAETRLLRRVHFTMRGLASTRTAHVDVTFGEHAETDGFVFPRTFVERVRAPLPVQAHAWYVTELAVER